MLHPQTFCLYPQGCRGWVTAIILEFNFGSSLTFVENTNYTNEVFTDAAPLMMSSTSWWSGLASMYSDSIPLHVNQAQEQDQMREPKFPNIHLKNYVILSKGHDILLLQDKDILISQGRDILTSGQDILICFELYVLSYATFV